MQKEIWKPVKGYEKSYAVSNLGRLISVDRYVTFTRNDKKSKKFIQGQFIQPRLRGVVGKNGGNSYLTATIGKRISGTPNEVAIHRLVAKTFIPNPQKKPQVNHKNCKKNDNRAINLEWVTEKENIAHAKKNGLLVRKK